MCGGRRLHPDLPRFLRLLRNRRRIPVGRGVKALAVVTSRASKDWNRWPHDGLVLAEDSPLCDDETMRVPTVSTCRTNQKQTHTLQVITPRLKKKITIIKKRKMPNVGKAGYWRRA